MEPTEPSEPGGAVGALGTCWKDGPSSFDRAGESSEQKSPLSTNSAADAQTKSPDTRRGSHGHTGTKLQDGREKKSGIRLVIKGEPGKQTIQGIKYGDETSSKTINQTKTERSTTLQVTTPPVNTHQVSAIGIPSTPKSPTTPPKKEPLLSRYIKKYGPPRGETPPPTASSSYATPSPVPSYARTAGNPTNGVSNDRPRTSNVENSRASVRTPAIKREIQRTSSLSRSATREVTRRATARGANSLRRQSFHNADGSLRVPATPENIIIAQTIALSNARALAKEQARGQSANPVPSPAPLRIHTSADGKSTFAPNSILQVAGSLATSSPGNGTPTSAPPSYRNEASGDRRASPGTQEPSYRPQEPYFLQKKRSYENTVPEYPTIRQDGSVSSSPTKIPRIDGTQRRSSAPLASMGPMQSSTPITSQNNSSVRTTLVQCSRVGSGVGSSNGYSSPFTGFNPRYPSTPSKPREEKFFIDPELLGTAKQAPSVEDKIWFSPSPFRKNPLYDHPPNASDPYPPPPPVYYTKTSLNGEVDLESVGKKGKNENTVDVIMSLEQENDFQMRIPSYRRMARSLDVELSQEKEKSSSLENGSGANGSGLSSQNTATATATDADTDTVMEDDSRVFI